MKLRHADLIVVLACLCLSVMVMTFASHILVARLAMTILLVFYLPGYALLCAISPLGEWGLPETFVVSIGLSLAVGVLGSLALHGLRLGLSQNTWYGMYLLHCTVCVVAAVIHRQVLDVPPVEPTKLPKPRLLPLIPVAVAVIMVFGAWMVGTMAQVFQHQDPFTQLWIVPCKTQVCDVELGVYNHEWATEDYHLVLMANTVVIEEWTDIQLKHSKSWTTSVRLPANYPTGTRLMARLFRTDAPETPYRYVSLRYVDPKE